MAIVDRLVEFKFQRGRKMRGVPKENFMRSSPIKDFLSKSVPEVGAVCQAGIRHIGRCTGAVHDGAYVDFHIPYFPLGGILVRVMRFGKILFNIESTTDLIPFETLMRLGVIASERIWSFNASNKFFEDVRGFRISSRMPCRIWSVCQRTTGCTRRGTETWGTFALASVG